MIGQDRALSLIRHSLEKGGLAHAYLFVGPSQVGKMTLALNLAQALNCEAEEPPCGQCLSCQKIVSAKHADVQVISLGLPEDTTETKIRVEISIDQIRELQHSASLPPFEGKHRVFIIDSAEFLSTEAANCLLKTLEEPAGKVIFILLTANERLLPTTVVSRCQRIALLPLAANEIEGVLIESRGIELEKARSLARLARGRLGWALQALGGNLLQQRDEWLDELLDTIKADSEQRFTYAARLATLFSRNRGEVRERLGLWLDWWHDLLLVKVGASGDIANLDRFDNLGDMAGGYSLTQIKTFIDNIRAAMEQLEQNANPQLVLEVLMLDIPKAKRPHEAHPAAHSR